MWLWIRQQMGPLINRRGFLVNLSALAAVAPIPTRSQAARYFGTAEKIEPEGLKVGPMPSLPPLPRRPYPYPDYFLFTHGAITKGGGFCWTQYLQQWVDAGFARSIPYGLNVQTDRQKLWLLGRTTFAPKPTNEMRAAAMHGQLTVQFKKVE
jgi:hypothetical protein